MIRLILCAAASLCILWTSPKPSDACGVKLSIGSSKVRRNLVAARQPLVPKRRQEERKPIRTGPTLGARGPALTGGGETASPPVGARVAEPTPEPADVKPKARKPKKTKPVEPVADSGDTGDSAGSEAVAKTGPTPEKDVGAEGDAPVVKGKGRLANRGYFANASSKLSPGFRAKLDETAKWLESNPDKSITVEGHTSSVGNADLNMRLSEKRAEAVKEYLVSKGVDESRITARGVGSDKLAFEPGRNPKNRRVEISID